MDELINANDLKWLVNEATNMFSSDLQLLAVEGTTRLDLLINLIDSLQKHLQKFNISTEYRKKGTASILYEQIEQEETHQVNQIYVELTRLSYLIRTYLTGETIAFLENIDGELRIIEQKDWLQFLSGQNETKYGISYTEIFLLESQIKELGKKINDSEFFTRTIDYNNIVNDVIEAATFKWSSDDHKPVKGKSYKEHLLYRKEDRDNWVYAYYTDGKRSTLQLLYRAKISYNLGHVQEELVNMLENKYLTEKAMNKLLIQLQGSHPVNIVINKNWRRNNVPGLTEGDFRTATGQWIQSKRNNEQVITMLQIHNKIIRLKELLLKLKEISTTPNTEKALEKLSKQFYKEFSSDQEKINQDLLNKIRLALPTLLNQSIV